MITRSLLLLLGILVYSFGIEHRIYLEQCGKTTDCFVRDSCVKAEDDNSAIVQYKGGDMNNKNCDFILQMRQYIPQKYYVTMQVNASQTTDDLKNSGVTLKQGADEIFSCKESGPSVNPKFQFKFAKQGVPIYDKKLALCSFTMESKDKAMIMTAFQDYIIDAPSVEFELKNKIVLTYSVPGHQFWSLNAPEKCNPELIDTSGTSTRDFILEEIDKFAFAPIDCGPGKSLIIKENNKDEIYLKENEKLVCNIAVWRYNKVNLPLTNTFKVSCGVRFCSQCEELQNLECDGCQPMDNKKDNGTCKIANCPADHQWRLEGDKTISGQMECQQEVGNPNSKKAFWYLNNEKVDKAGCFDKDICWRKVKLKEACPDETKLPADKECAKDKISISGKNNTKFECKSEPGLEMWYSTSNAAHPAGSSIDCDFKTGHYSNGTTEITDANTTVYCLKAKPPKHAAAAAASMDPKVFMYAGGGLLFLVLIGVIVAVVVCRKKKASKEEEKKSKAPRTVDLASVEVPSQLESKVESVVESAPVTRPKVSEPRTVKLPKLPEKEQTKFLDRPQNRPRNKELNENWYNKFSEEMFAEQLCLDFVTYKYQNQLELFYAMTELDAYSKNKEVKEKYGEVRHFFDLFRHLEVAQHDSIGIWDRAWSFVRLLQKVVKRKIPRDPKLLDTRLITVMINMAKPIYTELGWTKQPNERKTDSQMRFFVIRVLLWAGNAEVEKELARQADLPIDQLDLVVRPIVLGYAVRKLGRAAQIKAEHWQKLLEDPHDPARDEHGTIREHLLYALAMTPPEGADFKTLKEIIVLMCDYSKPATAFTPKEQFWFYQGAVEYDDNALAAIKIFTEYWHCDAKGKTRMSREQMDEMLKAKNPGAPPAELNKCRDQWLYSLTDICDKLADSCPDTEIDIKLNKAIYSLMCRYQNSPPEIDNKSEAIKMRLINLEELVKRKDLEDIIDKALQRIEEA